MEPPSSPLYTDDGGAVQLMPWTLFFSGIFLIGCRSGVAMHGPHSVQQNSFGYLKRLTAVRCHTVEHVIPSHLLSCFHNLEELQVHDCEAAQFIFNFNDENRLTKALEYAV